MRVMRPNAIATFSAGLTAVLVLALATAWLGWRYLGALGEFRSVVVSAIFVLFIYVYAIVVHRLLFLLIPLREGSIPVGHSQEYAYQVHCLFYLVLLNTLIRTRVIPVPIMRLVYLALGARLGPNTYCSGIMYDPMFINIGANTIVGESALLIPHVVEGMELAHFPIRIGNNVTIGANALVLAGTIIHDNATVAANAVVVKGTEIKAGEIWGGTPARLLSKVASAA
jgi:serine acetyltransferase